MTNGWIAGFKAASLHVSACVMLICCTSHVENVSGTCVARGFLRLSRRRVRLKGGQGVPLHFCEERGLTGGDGME